MTRLSTTLTAGYLGLAAADAWLAGSTRVSAARARLVTKPLLMPVLAASLAADPRAASSPLRTSTLFAQAFGWGGDVLLLGHGTSSFAAGAGSFGLGHLAYVAGFRTRRAASPAGRGRGAWGEPIAAGLFATGGPVMAVGAARRQPALGPAVLGYTGLLATMLGHATRLAPTVPRRARVLTVAGAALFTASDTLLGLRRFVWTGAPPRTESVVMVGYTAGQLLLSKGAAAAR